MATNLPASKQRHQTPGSKTKASNSGLQTKDIKTPSSKLKTSNYTLQADRLTWNQTEHNCLTLNQKQKLSWFVFINVHQKTFMATLLKNCIFFFFSMQKKWLITLVSGLVWNLTICVPFITSPIHLYFINIMSHTKNKSQNKMIWERILKTIKQPNN